ncbi:ACP S-malonyltransferase [Tunicatimonas pelagia]|uniref:ACP S-malonyltransferase n=1 Tax=Tunicatimonas pelagia TaxID=931531 RepID=UPI0026670914|nr:ACP S-malonyltransferase [Tunicatimonas pelagia]WKN43806.1 ACP S-malonyltransferase [Tunicatimonas pelagia]
MKHAYIFPGQGAQFPGMGKELFDQNSQAQELFRQADETLGFSISKIMFEGSEEDLKQTKVTQPAIFVHSVVRALVQEDFSPDMVAGHSLGEFSALVAGQVLSFTDGLRLVSQRATAMQKACEQNPSTMAAVLGLEDATVEDVCRSIKEEVVLPANYNSPGQIVISGTHRGIELATEALKEAGAKRVIPLAVGGAFHSPLMEPAYNELERTINQTGFSKPICPIYQNVTGLPAVEIEVVKNNLIAQLMAPVRWTQSVSSMLNDGATHFTECGPGRVLQGLVKKVSREAKVDGLS